MPEMCCKPYPVSTIFSTYEGCAHIFIIPDEEKEPPPTRQNEVKPGLHDYQVASEASTSGLWFQK